jgi:hypothetical protein
MWEFEWRGILKNASLVSTAYCKLYFSDVVGAVTFFPLNFEIVVYTCFKATRSIIIIIFFFCHKKNYAEVDHYFVLLLQKIRELYKDLIFDRVR